MVDEIYRITSEIFYPKNSFLIQLLALLKDFKYIRCNDGTLTTVQDCGEEVLSLLTCPTTLLVIRLQYRLESFNFIDGFSKNLFNLIESESSGNNKSKLKYRTVANFNINFVQIFHFINGRIVVILTCKF